MKQEEEARGRLLVVLFRFFWSGAELYEIGVGV